MNYETRFKIYESRLKRKALQKEIIKAEEKNNHKKLEELLVELNKLVKNI